VAVKALASHPDYLETPFGRQLLSLAFSAEMRSMAADIGGVGVLTALTEQRIAFSLVKGPSMALLHPRGWPRPYADLDILVAPDAYGSAVACAEDLGFTQSERAVPQWTWFGRICREGSNFHSASGGNLDFHHHIPPWSLASNFTVPDIISRSTPRQFYGTEVRFGEPRDLLVISAFHILNDLWKGKLGLASWRDVILLTRALGEADAGFAFERAGVPWLFDLFRAELASELPEAGIGSAPSEPAIPLLARLRLAGLGWANDSSATRHRLAWATRLPPLNALAFLAGSAVPSPTYVRSRHGTYFGYWKRGLVETASTLRGSDYRMTTVDDDEEPSPAG
jgi:hypothetical protein